MLPLGWVLTFMVGTIFDAVGATMECEHGSSLSSMPSFRSAFLCPIASFTPTAFRPSSSDCLCLFAHCPPVPPASGESQERLCPFVPFSPVPPAMASGESQVRPCLLSQPVVRAAMPKAFARTTNLSFWDDEAYNASNVFDAFAANASLPMMTPIIQDAASFVRSHARKISQLCIQVLVAVLACMAFRRVASEPRSRSQVIVAGVRHSRRIRVDFSDACQAHKRILFSLLMLGQVAQAFAGPQASDVVASVQESPKLSPAKTQAVAPAAEVTHISQPSQKAHAMPAHAASTNAWQVKAAMFVLPMAIVGIIFMMYPGAGNQTMRMPPTYDPNDQSQSFRTWSQDLMLWSISNDLQPHQQAAMIIAQLRGPKGNGKSHHTRRAL